MKKTIRISFVSLICLLTFSLFAQKMHDTLWVFPKSSANLPINSLVKYQDTTIQGVVIIFQKEATEVEFKNKGKRNEKFTSLVIQNSGEKDYQTLMRSNHCFILVDDKKVYPVLPLKSLKDIEKNPKSLFQKFLLLKERFKELLMGNLGIIFKA